MIRLLIAIGVALFLMPVLAMAEEPVVKVDCLCVAEEEGSVIGHSNAMPSQLGIDKIQERISGGAKPVEHAIVVLSADENRCGKYSQGCSSDKRYKALTGEVRMVLEGYGYMDTAKDFKLTILGNRANN